MRELLRAVKLEHTLFSLPYLMLGALLAGIPLFDLRTWALILAAGVGARGAGMLMNRIVDRNIDALNPRTRNRSLPAGRLSLSLAWVGVGLFSLMLVAAAWALNPLCLALSPVPLLAFYLYPYTKRFTPLCHFVLGLAWSIAPAGAWLAVRGSFEGFWPAAVLSLSVALWLAGFDIIYALLDLDFDTKHSVHSGPRDWGVDRALWVSRLSHAISFGLWVYLGLLTGLGPAYYIALGFVAVAFLLEHALAKRDPETAFFRLNVFIGFILLAGVIAARGI